MSQLSKLRKMEQEQGVLATAGFLFDRACRVLRTGHHIPPNTIKENRNLWTLYDWSKKGEEWTISAPWKKSLVSDVLEPHIPIGSRVLEIGPGAGRWTEALAPRAKHLTLVDLTPECIRLCKEQFGLDPKFEFFVNDGSDLSFIPDASIDRIWSFDVFVHIQSADIEKYVSQFPRVLVSGGVAVIHHAANGTNIHGWRSDMTATKMREFCEHYGLELVEQLSSCGGHGFEFGDVISILRRP